MKAEIVERLRCTNCAGVLSLTDTRGDVGGEIESGELRCADCNRAFPIVRYIPRFVPAANYADSFGFQWNHFRQTQLDSYSRTEISRRRFLRQTAWTREMLNGASVLDVGCGAGRFTEIALSLGATVFAVDYSQAVEACWNNMRGHERLSVIQGDIFSLPFAVESFDFVYCFGVLQHTPSPRGAFLSLPKQVRPEGSLVVDVYMQRFGNMLHPKYWLRPITTRISRPALFRLIERTAGPLLQLSNFLSRLPSGDLLRRIVPIANYRGIHPLSEEQLVEWSVLDTFDWLSPIYDRPQTAAALRSWFEAANFDDVEVLKVDHLVGRGRKPVPSN